MHDNLREGLLRQMARHRVSRVVVGFSNSSKFLGGVDISGLGITGCFEDHILGAVMTSEEMHRCCLAQCLPTGNYLITFRVISEV
jgi:hypothetical protein